MKRLFYMTASLALSCCATARAITLDGLNIPSEAWTLKATQNSPTQFGNNPGGSQGSPGGSELNQIFANYTAGNKLQIGITGNLEQNNNKLYVLFDGQAGGENVLAADNVDGPPTTPASGISSLANRITFPANVTMDHGLKIELSSAQNIYTVSYFNLINNTFSVVSTGAGVGALPLTNAGGGTSPVTFGWDNSNAAGVTATDASTANTATTGFEFEIDAPTAFNGLQGTVNIVAFIAGDTSSFLSNQSLPGFNSPTNIGGGNFTYTSVISVTTGVTPPLLPGDVDGNNVVNLNDFQIIRMNWLATSASIGHPIVRTDGDLNQNGVVDIQDFREWKGAFGGGAGAIAQALASLPSGTIPEPSSLALASLAGWPMLIGARRRRLYSIQRRPE
jgi:hypothetical protein